MTARLCTSCDSRFSGAEPAPQGPYEGDPVHPDTQTVTPAEIVAGLTRSDRELRMKHLVDQAHDIYDLAIQTHRRGRELVASCILFSGGNDSTTATHLFRGRATHAVHANTGIGILETRQYVRDVCASWGLPLIERAGDDSYEDLVLGKVRAKKSGRLVYPGAFPGPAKHPIMYGRLKERALDKVRHDLGVANSRTRCIVYIAGRRREESVKRADVPLHESDGTVIWVSPVAMWTKADLNTYRLMHPDVPVNPVTAKLHMSGECLCGAYAHPGELEELRFWYPEVAAYLDDLGRRAREAGVSTPERCVWGHGIRGRSKRKPTSPGPDRPVAVA